MPLFAVERDLSQVPPDRFRSDLRGLVSACQRLQSLGKRVRYISSAVFPAEARGLCLFGAEQPQWIREANEAACLPYLRIFAVLDLTPAGVRREVSCGRRSPHWATTPALARDTVPREPQNGVATANGRPAGSRASDEVARWSEEGRQILHVLGGWLEEAGRLQAQTELVQGDRDRLARELDRLRVENDELRAQRAELEQSLQTVATRMAEAADGILNQFARRQAPEDLAER